MSFERLPHLRPGPTGPRWRMGSLGGFGCSGEEGRGGDGESTIRDREGHQQGKDPFASSKGAFGDRRSQTDAPPLGRTCSPMHRCCCYTSGMPRRSCCRAEEGGRRPCCSSLEASLPRRAPPRPRLCACGPAVCRWSLTRRGRDPALQERERGLNPAAARVQVRFR